VCNSCATGKTSLLYITSNSVFFPFLNWNRRERLVDEMAALSNIGWQIIYFSMDDHIRRLFEERVKPIAKKRYQSFELKKEK
jgi:hypothetical protein